VFSVHIQVELRGKYEITGQSAISLDLWSWNGRTSYSATSDFHRMV